MCGIAGIHAYKAGLPPSYDELIAIRDAMRERGPDAAGQWTSSDGRTIFGHRRLSIIDLSHDADQPMGDGAGLTIVFNGEIYNHEALRSGLAADGQLFRTQSDTEVILHLYRRHGPAMLDMLRGMFALAIYDARDGSLFLARDPYGIKPVYYADDGEMLRFASSVRALAKGWVSSGMSDAALAGFLMLGTVPEPYTILKAVKALPAGHYLNVKDGVVGTPICWFSLAERMIPAEVERPLSSEEILHALHQSLDSHLVADTPVGLFLSAGIDSTLLLALLKDRGREGITTLTARFAEFEGANEDEAALAAQSAQFYGSNHIERTITRDEFREDLPRFLAHMDQPTIDGLNTWFIAKAAREQGLKVCLSGLGADEMFGGYPSFVDVPVWASRLAPLNGFKGRINLAAYGSRIFPPSIVHPKLFALLGLAKGVQGSWYVRRGLFMPWDITSLMGQDRGQAALAELDMERLIASAVDPDPGSDYGRVMLLESSLYMRNQLLRDSDWAGMAHSVEIRVPFVDSRLFGKLAPRLALYHKPGKRHLTQLPGSGMPSALIDRPKTGFTTPIGKWKREIQSDLPAARNRRKLSGGHWSRAWALDIMDMYTADVGIAAVSLEGGP